MKIQTVLTVVAVAFTLLASGCRYSKSGVGGADGDGLGGLGSDISTDVSSDDIQEGLLDDISGKSFKDRGYTRCTDVEFAPVYFGFDATAINPDELGKIEAVAKHLADNPDRVVTVEGNCDERGSNEYNVVLGQNRALMVVNFLGQNGVSAERSEAISRGETNPVAIGQGEEFWSQNRRGDFIIWKK